MKLHKSFLSFNYHGDEVLYVYPWARAKFSKRFLSMSLCAYASTLKGIDNLWTSYYNAERLAAYTQEYLGQAYVNGVPVQVRFDSVACSGVAGDLVNIEISVTKKEDAN